MEPYCGDLNVRARALTTRLVDRGRLLQLAASPDPAILRRELLRRELVDQGELAAGPESLETAARRSCGRWVALLERWAADRTDRLSPLFGDEERRSLRVLLRGAEQGAAHEVRLSGLVPTRRLPDAALGVLAEQRSVGDVIGLLASWRHPWSASLSEELAEAGSDLMRLELALDRAWAAEARRATRRAGSALRGFVAETIDLANGRSALALADQEREGLPDFFLEGGRRLPRAGFEEIAEAGGRPEALDRLIRVLEPSGLAPTPRPDEPRSLEARLLRLRLETHRRAARLDPVGAEPLVSFVLAMRAHLLDLGRVIWGVALGASAEQIAEDWVTT